MAYYLNGSVIAGAFGPERGLLVNPSYAYDGNTATVFTLDKDAAVYFYGSNAPYSDTAIAGLSMRYHNGTDWSDYITVVPDRAWTIADARAHIAGFIEKSGSMYRLKIGASYGGAPFAYFPAVPDSISVSRVEFEIIYSLPSSSTRASFVIGGDGRYIETFSTTTYRDNATTASWTGDGDAEMDNG